MLSPRDLSIETLIKIRRARRRSRPWREIELEFGLRQTNGMSAVNAVRRLERLEARGLARGSRKILMEVFRELLLRMWPRGGQHSSSLVRRLEVEDFVRETSTIIGKKSLHRLGYRMSYQPGALLGIEIARSCREAGIPPDKIAIVLSKFLERDERDNHVYLGEIWKAGMTDEQFRLFCGRNEVLSDAISKPEAARRIIGRTIGGGQTKRETAWLNTRLYRNPENPNGTIHFWVSEGSGKNLEVRIPMIYFVDKKDDEKALLKVVKREICGMLNGSEE